MTLTADWNNARLSINGLTATIDIPDITIRATNDSGGIIDVDKIRVTDGWQFNEGVPKKSYVMPNFSGFHLDLYYEVLDSKRNIFLIGFK